MVICTVLCQTLKREPLSSGFSTDGFLISASTIPQCRVVDATGGQETRVKTKVGKKQGRVNTENG